ncbi:hypothetical protein TUN199_10028 [Pyrenophora tritici-repentis]|nr:hypothetical protein Alg130_10031 [Pyrenophora tritici-repentis]KAI0617977.1 hypothetical protein TUN199_10028 [Pyrenophora tritici-repentis]
MPPPRPPFSSLPLSPSGPPLNAWSLYGPSDTLGALNTLTPTVTRAAALEIRTGNRISLDWYLNLPSHPSFSRPPFAHKMTNKTHPDGTKRTVNDDHLDFNTQCSSQWDGLRHYGYQGRKLYYGGRTQEDLEDSDILGIDGVAHKGASDAPSFEMAPLVGPHTAPGNLWAGKPWEQELQGGGLIHQVLLGGWGVMIGEMFDLERLCEKSVELGRSTCFVSSVPLKVPGGVASPPNAVAIF